MAIISIFVGYQSESIIGKSIATLLMCGAAIIGIALISMIWNGYLQSCYDLWHIGKIHGLWKDSGLVKQLQKNFSSSHKIKIKVTRGSELLRVEKYGFRKALEQLKDGKGKTHESPVNIQILLVLPCYQEEHVRQRRYAGSRKKEMTDEKFLESWYKFLQDIREYESDHLSIDIKFYCSSHARWRFYIFERANESEKSCVLLSEYDNQMSGIDKPMYKIIQGERNIAAFMCNYFDELWNENSTLSPKEFYTYVQTNKCQSHFCSNCNAQSGSNCINCGRVQCEHESLCRQLTEKYKDILYNFF